MIAFPDGIVARFQMPAPGAPLRSHQVGLMDLRDGSLRRARRQAGSRRVGQLAGHPSGTQHLLPCAVVPAVLLMVAGNRRNVTYMYKVPR